MKREHGCYGEKHLSLHLRVLLGDGLISRGGNSVKIVLLPFQKGLNAQDSKHEVTTHYENTPIQIYWKFFYQKIKKKKKKIKNFLYFSHFC